MLFDIIQASRNLDNSSGKKKYGLDFILILLWASMQPSFHQWEIQFRSWKKWERKERHTYLHTEEVVTLLRVYILNMCAGGKFRQYSYRNILTNWHHMEAFISLKSLCFLSLSLLLALSLFLFLFSISPSLPLTSLSSISLKDTHHSVFSFIYFYVSRVALHCCVSFCYKAKWINHMYTYIPSFLNFLPI